MIPKEIANLIQKRPKTDEEYNTLNDFLSSVPDMSCSEFVDTIRSIARYIKSDRSVVEAYRFQESFLKIFERDYSAHLAQKLLLLHDILKLCYECDDYKRLRI